jgi:hypothetical protein
MTMAEKERILSLNLSRMKNREILHPPGFWDPTQGLNADKGFSPWRHWP